SKAFVPNLISEVLGVKGVKLNSIEEFAKSNIEFKTIRLEPNGIPKEHMSFEQIDFNEWIESDWENSHLHNRFEESKFLLVVFQYLETQSQNPLRKLYFKGVKLWNMPELTLETEVKNMWIDTK